MKSNNKPRVYSYARFSSKPQEKGDSERRQMEAIQEAERFAAAKGLVLDENLRMFDKGFSGFHGTNKSKGALGLFLQDVKAKKVPPGSILLVENMDRLSREPFLEALSTVIDLLQNQIVIETLNPRHTYTRESVNSGAHYHLVAHIERAHAESQRKSELAKANWKHKRGTANKALLLTGRAPAWLKVTSHKANDRVIGHDVSVIPEAAETIRAIFRLKLEGFGMRSIERKLNGSPEFWVPGKYRKGQRGAGWRESYIKKILRNRSVLGEFQPHGRANKKRVPVGDPITDYFPSIVAPDVFNAVQKRLDENSNGKAAGRTGELKNILRHLAVCGYCGAPMAFENKGEGSKGGQYLRCDAARRGVFVPDGSGGSKQCVRHPVHYFEVETTVLDNCSKLKPELVLPDSGEQAEEAKRMRTRIEGLGAERSAVEREKSKLIENMARLANAEMLARCEKLYTELQEKDKALASELERAESALAQTERSRESFDEWLKNLAGLKKAIARDRDVRLRLNAHLKEFITKIEIFPTGHDEDIERADDIIESIPELVRSPALKSFRKYVAQRLRSEEGRCFRIHFKTGPAKLANLMTPLDPKTKKQVAKTTVVAYAGMQVAPAGSLAYKNEFQGKSRSGNGPEVGRLIEEFFDGRKPGFIAKGSYLRTI